MYKFCNGDINNFFCYFKKDIYPCEYMDSWERFKETTLPNEKGFYGKLYLEDITDEDYLHA